MVAVIALSLATGVGVALGFSVLVCKGFERLFQGVDLRLQLEHPLIPGGIFAPTGTCKQSGGQQDTDRHRTQVSQRAGPIRRWGDDHVHHRLR